MNYCSLYLNSSFPKPSDTCSVGPTLVTFFGLALSPPVTFSINGKQYVAVLAGARQNPVILSDYPELKNTSPASMLYVFSL